MKFLNGWTKKSVIKRIEEKFKGKALDKNRNLCLYKTEDGKKCAVGLFIADTDEANNFQGSVSTLINAYPHLKKTMPFDLETLDVLQMAHDRGESECAYNDHRTDEEVLMDLISFIESEA